MTIDTKGDPISTNNWLVIAMTQWDMGVNTDHAFRYTNYNSMTEMKDGKLE